LVGQWIDLLRQVARAMRSQLLELFPPPDGPRGPQDFEELGKRADKLASDVLLHELEARGVSCTLVCEDLGTLKLGGPSAEGPYLVVDPLDGTRNFSRGIPVASISMAVCSGPSLTDVSEALVLELFSGQEFWAVSGQGAFSGSARLSVSKTREISKAVVSLDESRLSGEPGWVTAIASAADATRQLGSAALELCFVASGALDAHVDLRGRIRPMDVAAGILIAREAGAHIWLRGSMRVNGALDTRERVLILASTPGLFDQLKLLLSPYVGAGVTLRGRGSS